jgi:hypothetical protein
MKNTILVAAIVVFSAFAWAAPAPADAPLESTAPVRVTNTNVTAVVFTWKNMGLMGPGDASAHYISVTRDSDVLQHSIDYNGGEILQKIILYKTDDNARFLLLDALGSAAKSWNSSYKENIVDGSAWRVVIHYTDGAMKEFDGYGKTPPRADEIKDQVMRLAKYKIQPKLF